MEKEQRNRLQKATQDARRLLEEEFRSQLLQTYDIDVDKVRWADEPGAHLLPEQRLIREKLIAWVEHKEAQINNRKEALLLALREMAFTALNRFVALKLMEARELVRPCVSGGLESAGFLEFTAVAQGLLADQESSYRLYLETIFEDVSRELRALFDPRDPASLLWPKRTALLELLDILNRPELAELWSVDECIGWVYQYFNSKEERQEMRKSAAPRNSRELAVRNQFFTPRYVVEFLTDNTLGRIWYEMKKGETRLAEQCRYLVRRPTEIFLGEGEILPETPENQGLSQEELLQQPVHIPFRPLKDPREIRLLDPACGSMHMGLYAFELFQTIYEEAWEAGWCEAHQEVYGSKSDFLKEVPRLIVEHNIHGVDIDPRAVQIAGLSLWIRAQKAWQVRGISPADRPLIRRSNIVCAEPMPGSPEMLEEFVGTLDSPLLGELVKAVFEKMQLAGEAGSLLRIDEEIRSAIDAAQEKWLKHQYNLLTRKEISQHDFFETAEHQIIDALQAYAKQADAGLYQRRLFADDAARGFAFIDLCRKRYDAIVMNPPFGQPSQKAKAQMSRDFSGCKDIYSAFVQLGLNKACTAGLVGAITSRTGFFQSKFKQWRVSTFIEQANPIAVADLGEGVLDSAMVETAAYCLRKGGCEQSAFIRLLDVVEKDSALIGTIERIAVGEAGLKNAFVVSVLEFTAVPGSPLAYWVSSKVRGLFRSLQTFESEARTVRQGLATCDDFRFVRAKWEIPLAGFSSRWFSFSKGGVFSPYYADIHLVVNWKADGGEIKAGIIHRYPYLNGNAEFVAKNTDFYFRPGYTYPLRTTRLCPQVLPAGTVISVRGSGIFGDTSGLYLALLSSLPFDYFIKMMLGWSSRPQFDMGDINVTPVPSISETVAARLAQLALNSVRVKRNLDCLEESTNVFVHPLGDSAQLDSLGGIGDKIAAVIDLSSHQLAAWQSEIDEMAFSLYGLDEDDRARMAGDAVSGSSDNDDDESDNDEDTKEDQFSANVIEASAAEPIISYAVGTTFGRWDVRYATGERRRPELSDPFDPLPVCPPGMLQSADGLPAQPNDVPAYYPLRISWSGILVDDENHGEDIVARVREAIEVLWKDRAEDIEQEASTILGVQTLRDYFRRPAGFFAGHLKRYSKSRRQAPIYWPLSSGSGSYSVWLYYHYFTADTLYQVLDKFVQPRIQEAEREQFALESQGVLSGDDAIRLVETNSLLQDLRFLKKELDVVAPLWNPNLNDGVIINHSLLWRITPYTPWQKKCKECWDKLVKGDYDWAHLAFHLWPERVIPKCTTDRSLAIAHGLE
jgi:hypothetical protein